MLPPSRAGLPFHRREQKLMRVVAERAVKNSHALTATRS
jgi:hypothetical protein